MCVQEVPPEATTEGSAGPPERPASAVPRLALVDPDRLQRLDAALGRAEVGRLMAQALDDMESGMAQMRRLLAVPDAAALAVLAHGLAGMATNYGLLRLGEALRPIAPTARGGDLAMAARLLAQAAPITAATADAARAATAPP